MYIESVVADAQESQQNKIENLKAVLEKLNLEIATSVEEALHNEVHARDLEFTMQELSTQQAAFEGQVKQVEKNLYEISKNNVEMANKSKAMMKTLKAIAAVAKVFPAGQPALAVAGNALDTVTSVPENGDVTEWLDYLDKNQDSFEELKEKADWGASKKELGSFFKKFDPSSNPISIEFLRGVQQLSQESQDRLLYFYHVAIRSYEYTTLQPVADAYNVIYMAAKMKDILKNKPHFFDETAQDKKCGF